MKTTCKKSWPILHLTTFCGLCILLTTEVVYKIFPNLSVVAHIFIPVCLCVINLPCWIMTLLDLRTVPFWIPAYFRMFINFVLFICFYNIYHTIFVFMFSIKRLQDIRIHYFVEHVCTVSAALSKAVLP